MGGYFVKVMSNVNIAFLDINQDMFLGPISGRLCHGRSIFALWQQHDCLVLDLRSFTRTWKLLAASITNHAISWRYIAEPHILDIRLRLLSRSTRSLGCVQSEHCDRHFERSGPLWDHCSSIYGLSSLSHRWEFYSSNDRRTMMEASAHILVRSNLVH